MSESPVEVAGERTGLEHGRRGPTADMLPSKVGRLTLLAVGVIAMFFLLMPTGVQAESAAPITVPHVVQQGDTLWELAIEITPAGGDVRATVAVIKDANNMTSSMLVAGDLIEIPVVP